MFHTLYRRMHLDESGAGGAGDDTGAGGDDTGAGGGGGTGDDTGAGGGEREWMKGMSESIRSDKNLRRFDSLEAALQSVGKMRTERDARPPKGAVVVPGEGATEEQRKAYREHMGIPEDKDGYQLKPTIVSDPTNPTFMPAAKQTAAVDKIRAAAHDAGLTQSQAQRMLDVMTDSFRENIADSMAARQKADQANQEELQRVFGDDIDAKLAAAKEVMARFGAPDERGNWLADFQRMDSFPGGVGNHPAWLRYNAIIASAINEHGMITGEGSPSDTGGDDFENLEWDFSKRGPLGVTKRAANA